MQLTLALAALIMLLQQAQPPQAGTAVVEGTITRAGSGLPIEAAQVGVGSENGTFSAVTDANGHYAISGIPAGTFALEIFAVGYLPEPKPFSAHRLLSFSDSQRLTVDVALTPLGAIQGRILDDNREPLTDINVELLQLVSDPQGRPVWGTVGNFTTDQKGAYRFENLSPAEYYIRASRKPTDDVPQGRRVDVAPTFFPGTSDARSALAVRLADADVTAEFPLANTPTYAISGRVSRPDQKRINSKVSLFVVPQDPRVPINDIFAAGVSFRAADGGNWDFELGGLLPGVYDLYAVTETSIAGEQIVVVDPNGVRRVEDKINEVIHGRFAATTIQISNEDLRDLRLSLEPGVDIKGRVEVLDNVGKPMPFEIQRLGAPDGNKPKNSQLAVILAHKDDNVTGFLHLEPARTQFPEQNAFVIESVPAGTYSVGVQAPDGLPDFYVADIRAGARSVYDDGLTVTTADPGPLEVVVGLDGGRIEGTVTGGKDLPVMAVLAPISSRRQNRGLFQFVLLERATDPLRITGVAPGSYSLFAFEVSSLTDLVPYRSADFLAVYETRSAPVTVQRNTTTGPVRVQVIPREQWSR